MSEFTNSHQEQDAQISETLIDVPVQTSWDAVEVREYTNGRLFVWDKPGSVVNLAPVPRRHVDRKYANADFYCTEEGDHYIMPDLFDVNGGDRQAVVGMTTGFGNQVIIVDGYLYTLEKGVVTRALSLDDYIAHDPIKVGETWKLLSTTGGRTMNIGHVRSVELQEIARNRSFLDIQSMPAYDSRYESTGGSALLMKAAGLRQRYNTGS